MRSTYSSPCCSASPWATACAETQPSSTRISPRRRPPVRSPARASSRRSTVMCPSRTRIAPREARRRTPGLGSSAAFTGDVSVIVRRAMRAVVQRVSAAQVTVDGTVRAEIGAGLCVLLGVARGDRAADAEQMAGKIARLRVFENEAGRFDRSLLDTGGAALVVSQFTLIADTAKGNRPSFSDAARPEEAESLYERVCGELRALGVPVQTGVFGARMRIELVNDGPVTLVLEL